MMSRAGRRSKEQISSLPLSLLNFDATLQMRGSIVAAPLKSSIYGSLA